MQHPSRPLLHTLCSTLLTPLQEVTDWSAARVAGAACRCALAELRLVSAQGDPLPTCTSLSKAWAMGHCPRLDLKGQRQQFISSCPDSTGTEGAAPHTWHPPSPSPQPPHHRLCHHHDRFPGVLVAVSPPPRPPLSSRPKRTRTGMRHPCISDRRAARGRLDLGTWYTMGLPKAQGQRSIQIDGLRVPCVLLHTAGDQQGLNARFPTRCSRSCGMQILLKKAEPRTPRRPARYGVCPRGAAVVRGHVWMRVRPAAGEKISPGAAFWVFFWFFSVKSGRF